MTLARSFETHAEVVMWSEWRSHVPAALVQRGSTYGRAATAAWSHGVAPCVHACGFGARTPIGVFAPLDVTLLHMCVSSCGLTLGLRSFAIPYLLEGPVYVAKSAMHTGRSVLVVTLRDGHRASGRAHPRVHVSVGSLGCAQLHVVVT